MSANHASEGVSAECEALAASWPRALIAAGNAPALAAWWIGSRDRAIERGLPRFARHVLDDSLAEGLFEARRARRLERGLEGAETRLAAEAAGLDKVPESQARPDQIRISRLLVVSADGSERFYREVEKLRARFSRRLEVLVLECDETELGSAAFGPGRRARALLLDHKDAVIRFLSILDIA